MSTRAHTTDTHAHTHSINRSINQLCFVLFPVPHWAQVNLVLIGALLMLANLTMESVRLVMTQFLLVGCDMHPLQSLKYIAPAATLTLIVGSAVKEYPVMRATGGLAIVHRNPQFFLVAACMGLVVNILGVVIIKLSSATTLKVGRAGGPGGGGRGEHSK